MNIEELSKKIKSHLRMDFVQKTWGFMPIPEEMINDGYMALQTFMSNYLDKLKDNKELSDLYTKIDQSWTFNPDSLLAQSDEIKEGLIKIFDYLI